MTNFTDENLRVWKAALNKEEKVTMNGFVIHKPSITFEPPNAITKSLAPSTEQKPEVSPGDNPPASGFLLKGTIDLFGDSHLKADFYSHQAPAVVGATTVPVYHLAVLNGQFYFATLLRSASATRFDPISLQNGMFTYQNAQLNKRRVAGWHLEADLLVDPSLGGAYTILTKTLKLFNPAEEKAKTLKVHTVLGNQPGWASPLNLPSFTMKGTFTGPPIKPYTGLTMFRVSLTLRGFKNNLPAQNGGGGATRGVVETDDFVCDVQGLWLMDFPGSATPVALDFTIKGDEHSNSFQLSAVAKKEVKHAFGIKNLILKDVKLAASFTAGEQFSDLKFNITATLDVEPTPISLSGTFSMKGDGAFSLTGIGNDTHWSTIGGLYEQLYKGQLINRPHLGLDFGDAQVAIKSGSGLSLTLAKISLPNSFTTQKAKVEFDSTGVSITADLGDGKLHFDPVTIVNCKLQIKGGRESDGKETTTLFNGQLHWNGSIVDVQAHIYKKLDGAGYEHTVLGYLEPLNRGGRLSLRNLMSAAENTFLDEISLESSCLIVASKDNPSFGSMKAPVFAPAIQKGIHAYATVGHIKQLGSMTMRTLPTLCLTAEWNPVSSSFASVKMIFSSDVRLTLLKGLISGPVSLRVADAKPPQMKLLFTASIPVTGQAESLSFESFGALGGNAAYFSGNMAGSWKDPFRVGSGASIEGLTFGSSIKYDELQPPAGSANDTQKSREVLKSLAFGGRCQIGKVVADVHYVVDGSPSDKLLGIKVPRMDFEDLASFVTPLISHQLKGPKEAMTFNNVQAYIYSRETTVGGTAYPAGFRLASLMTIIGETASIELKVQDKVARIAGTVDKLRMGTVPATGIESPAPLINLEFSKSMQHGTIKGLLTFETVRVPLHADLQLTNAAVECTTALQFNFLDLFPYNAQATPVASGEFRFSQDFALTASFDSITRELLNKKFVDLLDQLRTGTTSKAAAANNVAGLEANLKTSTDLWLKKQQDFHKHYESVEKAEDKKISTLVDALDEAVAGRRAKIATAEVELDSRKAARELAIKKNETLLSNISERRGKQIAAAQKALNDASITEPDTATQLYEDTVNEIMNEIKKVDHQIELDEKAHRWDLPIKAGLPTRLADREALRMAKRQADSALAAAKAVATGPDALSHNARTTAAASFLDKEQKAGADEEAEQRKQFEATLRDLDKKVGEAEAALKVVKDDKDEVEALKRLEAARGVRNAALAATKADMSKEFPEKKAWIQSVEDLRVARDKQSLSSLFAKEGVVLDVNGSRLQHLSADDISKLFRITKLELASPSLNAFSRSTTFQASVGLMIQAGTQRQVKLELDYNIRETAKFLARVFEKLVAEAIPPKPAGRPCPLGNGHCFV